MPHRFSRMLVVIVIFMIFICRSEYASGKNIKVLNLDSLVYDASDVVEAHIIGPREGRTEWIGQDEVSITAVYQGDLHVGDVCIVTGLSGYMKPWDGHSSKGLGAGDDVFLFLHGNGTSALRPLRNEIFNPISSGVRWIDAGKVICFDQPMNPGPLEADEGSPYRKIVIPTPDDFRKTLKQKVVEMDQLRRQMNSQPDIHDAPWVLQAIADQTKRADPNYRVANDVLMALVDRINHFQDPQIAYQAMCINPRLPLGQSFATPQGREFLLAKFSAADTAEQMRANLIWMIGEAGTNYQFTADRGRTGDVMGMNQPFVANNAAYVTRVVRVVVANAGQKDVWESFIRMQDFWILSADYVKDPEYRKDVFDAASILTDFYKNGANQRQQFDIETIVAKLGRDEYEKLGNIQTPVIAIIFPEDHYDTATPPAPYVVFRCEYFKLPWIKTDREDPTGDVLIVKSVLTGKETVVCGISGPDGGSGTEARSLPKNLPPGQYHIFVHMVHWGRVVGESRGFEIDQNGTPITPTTRP